jgi:hypothetical protein
VAHAYNLSYLSEAETEGSWSETSLGIKVSKNLPEK